MWEIGSCTSCAGRLKTESFKIDFGLIAEWEVTYLLSKGFAVMLQSVIIASPSHQHFQRVLIHPPKNTEGQTSSMFSLDPISS